MPYVHLANGDVKHLTAKELVLSREESGTPHAFRMDGMEHTVIGVFPDEVEHPESEEVLAQKAETEKADRAEFEAWKASQKTPHDPASSEVDWSVGSTE
jgi:hypothetical protein